MSQGKVTSNIGQTGVESIRLGGMRIDDLPIGEAAKAKLQLPEALAVERQNNIESIKARYPQQDVKYLESRIREARGMIAQFRQQRDNIVNQCTEYRMLLRDAEKREKEIADAKNRLTGEELKAEIKTLTAKYGPWQVEGLKSQLIQFDEAIKRFDATIEREQASINELTELLGECRSRDKELTRLGA